MKQTKATKRTKKTSGLGEPFVPQEEHGSSRSQKVFPKKPKGFSVCFVCFVGFVS
jgi:hypothetical protein